MAANQRSVVVRLFRLFVSQVFDHTVEVTVVWWPLQAAILPLAPRIDWTIISNESEYRIYLIYQKYSFVFSIIRVLSVVSI